MSTLSKFIKKLQSAGINNDQSYDKYRLVKPNEFEVFWYFNNGTAINDATSMTKLLNSMPGSIGYDESGNTRNNILNSGALIEDPEFHIIGIDMANIESGEHISIGGEYEKNPGINSVIFANAMITPQEYELTITMRDTQNSPVDNFITQWIYMNASPKGMIPPDYPLDQIKSYRQKLLANIKINLIHNYIDYKPNRLPMNVKKIFRSYLFEDAFPNTIDYISLSDEKSEFVTRKIDFKFSRFKPLTEYKETSYRLTAGGI